MIRRSKTSRKAAALLPHDKLSPQPPQKSELFNSLVHLFLNLSCLSCPYSSKDRDQNGQVSGVGWHLSAIPSMTIPAMHFDLHYSKAIHKVIQTKLDDCRRWKMLVQSLVLAASTSALVSLASIQCHA